MSLKLNFNEPKTANSNDKSDRPQPQVWLNIGVNSTDPETGEVTFISLPFGLPLDTMEPKTITGTNEDWRRMLAAKNALLDAIQKMSADVAPGEEQTIEGLSVQIRRRASQEAPAAEDNNLLSGIHKLGFAAKAG